MYSSMESWICFKWYSHILGLKLQSFSHLQRYEIVGGTGIKKNEGILILKVYPCFEKLPHTRSMRCVALHTRYYIERRCGPAISIILYNFFQLWAFPLHISFGSTLEALPLLFVFLKLFWSKVSVVSLKFYVFITSFESLPLLEMMFPWWWWSWWLSITMRALWAMLSSMKRSSSLAHVPFFIWLKSWVVRRRIGRAGWGCIHVHQILHFLPWRLYFFIF